MKKLLKIKLLSVVIMVALPMLAVAQTPDTLTTPDRPRTHVDPKITEDNNSKILLDTTLNVDSLIDKRKNDRNTFPVENREPVGDKKKPAVKKVPGDKGKVARP